MWRHEKQSQSKMSFEKKSNSHSYEVACLTEVSSKFIQEKATIFILLLYLVF